MSSWRELRSPEGYTSVVTGIAFAPDGKPIVSSSHDATLWLWDAASGKELRCFTGHTMLVYSLTLSQDGKRLGSCSFDGTARVWDVATGKEAAKLPASDARCVGFAPDGKWLLAGDKLLDFGTGKEVHNFGHAIPMAAFSLDSRRLVTNSHDTSLLV
ncbi:MAG TPA: hypothetical protein VEL76_10170 [Gemmataceae bacterium]|nr:hypothetical protein [Gemmataceae bacterium]